MTPLRRQGCVWQPARAYSGRVKSVYTAESVYNCLRPRREARMPSTDRPFMSPALRLAAILLAAVWLAGGVEPPPAARPEPPAPPPRPAPAPTPAATPSPP